MKAKVTCGAYLGDNDATCPQTTCIRDKNHKGLCDNVHAHNDDLHARMLALPPDDRRDFLIRMDKLMREADEAIADTKINEPPVYLGPYRGAMSCPTCDSGQFAGTRDRKTFKLVAEDRCLLCGQPGIWTV